MAVNINHLQFGILGGSYEEFVQLCLKTHIFDLEKDLSQVKGKHKNYASYSGDKDGGTPSKTI